MMIPKSSHLDVIYSTWFSLSGLLFIECLNVDVRAAFSVKKYLLMWFTLESYQRRCMHFLLCCNNYYKFSDLKQHKFVILQFPTSEVQNQSLWAKIKVFQGLFQFLFQFHLLSSKPIAQHFLFVLSLILTFSNSHPLPPSNEDPCDYTGLPG